jgi:hypothetical protein
MASAEKLATSGMMGFAPMLMSSMKGKGGGMGAIDMMKPDDEDERRRRRAVTPPNSSILSMEENRQDKASAY